MIIEQRISKFNIGYLLLRVLVFIIKIIAIYSMLTMAYSFSIIFLIFMIFILFLFHKLGNSIKDITTQMIATPLYELKKGIVKVEGRADVKNPIIAPLNNRLCIGYSYQVYDIGSNGNLSLVKNETHFNDFILFADGKHIEVKAENIDFDVPITAYLERDINNQKHVQKTLCQSDQVIIVADAILNDDGTYQLKYTKKKGTLIIETKQNNKSSAKKRKIRPYFPLIFFTACIVISLLLMGYVGTDKEGRWVVFWTFGQLLFGLSSVFFDISVPFYIILPECLSPMIESRSVMPIIIMIAGSFIGSYILYKLTSILKIHYIVFTLANISLIAGIICSISGFVLILSAEEFFFFKLTSIWITIFSFGLLTMLVNWIDNQLSIRLSNASDLNSLKFK